MSEQFIEDARENMGAIEKLFKGLPGINDYVDKELRRSADKQLREQIVTSLNIQKQNLLLLQNKLLKSSGLHNLSNIDTLVRRLQTLIDRIKTASYGYAGLFSDNPIREEQLEALQTVDRELATKAIQLETTVQNISAALNTDQVDEALDHLSEVIQTMDNIFLRRQEVILSPELRII
jgi:hypothetical protein